MKDSRDGDGAGTPAAPRCPTRTILVVDDHAAICHIVAWHLSVFGFRVLTATDPFSARQIAQSEGDGIDLLLTDMEMPSMSGRELADWFSREYPRTRIILMSSNPQYRDVLDTAWFLEKPFPLTALDAAVRHAFGSARKPGTTPPHEEAGTIQK